MFRFNVHCSTVSQVFVPALDVPYIRLKPLIIWPDIGSLKKTMPMTFSKHFPNCAAFIDCFELFLERPTNLFAHAQMYSSYQHHNTVKYLTGITPQGTVSFISEGWGRRTSDKYITKHSTCVLLLNTLYLEIHYLLIMASTSVTPSASIAPIAPRVLNSCIYA